MAEKKLDDAARSTETQTEAATGTTQTQRPRWGRRRDGDADGERAVAQPRLADQAAGPACSSRSGECVRIHVAGLGPSVLASDLSQTFSSVAPVSSVDIIRTKGRSFAYITFLSPSPQAIRRVFTLFNGCIWKGGRLKLEKAKELYLDKLRREWEERDCLNDKEDTGASEASVMVLSKSLPQIDQSEDLGIYFPGLRKVKRIPVKGLGRHKRSFERVDARPCALLEYSIGDGDGKSALPTRAKEMMTSTEIALNDVDDADQSLQSKRSKVPETVTQTIRLDRKGKSSPRKRVKLSREIPPTNAIFKEKPKDQLEVLERMKEVQEYVQGERCMLEKKVNVMDMQPIKSKKDVSSEAENHCMSMVQRESKELNYPDVTNWFQKGSWRSLVGQTGRISFKVLG